MGAPGKPSSPKPLYPKVAFGHVVTVHFCLVGLLPPRLGEAQRPSATMPPEALRANGAPEHLRWTLGGGLGLPGGVVLWGPYVGFEYNGLWVPKKEDVSLIASGLLWRSCEPGLLLWFGECRYTFLVI